MNNSNIYRFDLRRYGVYTLLLLTLIGIGLFSYKEAVAQVIPTILIANVDVGNTVTIMTNNFPANENFTVSMGPYGTLGVGQTVTRFNSGAGGQQFFSFPIPDGLKGERQISIRTQSDHLYPYFSYNWFWNIAQPVPVNPPPVAPVTVVSGNPRIFIQSVVQNQSVTISGSQFPANQEFVVTMGNYGTGGANGIVVERFNSGGGGNIERTFAIPSQLAGQQRIAVRLSTQHPYPFFAFNWFWNNTAP